MEESKGGGLQVRGRLSLFKRNEDKRTGVAWDGRGLSVGVESSAGVKSRLSPLL